MLTRPHVLIGWAGRTTIPPAGQCHDNHFDWQVAHSAAIRRTQEGVRGVVDPGHQNQGLAPGTGFPPETKRAQQATGSTSKKRTKSVSGSATITSVGRQLIRRPCTRRIVASYRVHLAHNLLVGICDARRHLINMSQKLTEQKPLIVSHWDLQRRMGTYTFLTKTVTFRTRPPGG